MSVTACTSTVPLSLFLFHFFTVPVCQVAAIEAEAERLRLIEEEKLRVLAQKAEDRRLVLEQQRLERERKERLLEEKRLGDLEEQRRMYKEQENKRQLARNKLMEKQRFEAVQRREKVPLCLSFFLSTFPLKP